jgi:outer membrane lipoprotein-sorting protein
MTGGALILMLLSLLPAGAAAQRQARLPEGDEILERMARGFEGVEDYTVTIDAVAELERLNVPPMTATMYYKRPDKVHFDSKGFALLPREGVALNPERLRARFTAVAVAPETLGGRSVLRLTLKPRNDRTGLRELFLDVDSSRWTPERLVSPQFDGRTMTATLTHARVQGHWLPSELLVRFTSTRADTAAEPPAEGGPGATRPAPPRRGAVTVRYSSYRLNTGLSDDLFTRPDPTERK